MKKINKGIAILASDLHIRPAHQEVAVTVLDRLLNVLKEEMPEYYINNGDTFHTKNLTYVSALNLYRDFLIKVDKLGIKTIQLVGNHDFANPYYTAHALDSFKNISDSITIVDDYYQLDENNFFLSYCREKERFVEFLSKAGKASRIFTHMDLNGLTPGSDWVEINEFFDPEYFSKYKQVFNGHIHLAQEKILKTGTEIVVIGSGYTTNFGETDQLKRFIKLDLSSGKWESINTGLTLHKTIEIKGSEKLPEIPLDEVNKGIEYRVIVTCTKEEYAILDKPPKYPAKVIPKFVSKKVARMDLSATESRVDILNKYTEEEVKRSYQESGFDLEKLLKIGKKFLPKG